MPADRRVLALIQRWLNSAGEDEHQGQAELLDRLRLAINTVSVLGLIDFAVTPTFNGGTVLTNPLLSSLLFSPDNTLDIGAVGATRARDLFLARNLVMGGDATISGLLKTGSGPATLTDATGKLVAIDGTRFASLSGANLTNLAADQLATGTVPTARLGSGTASVETFLRGDQTWATGFAQVCQGRLTLTTAVPVTTADVTGATSVFFTPYGGNRIALYNGTNWKLFAFSEISLALGIITNDLPYDVFIYDNAGTLTLEFLAWTNKTTRATALVLQDGVLSKTGALTRRYLGTFHTTSTTTTEDSKTKRLLWNYYNRSRRVMRKLPTGTWTYTTNTFRQANADTANQLAVVVGVAEVSMWAHYSILVNNDQAASSAALGVSIGEDSTTTPHADAVQTATANVGVSVSTSVQADLMVCPPIGYHFYAALEKSSAVGTTNWLAVAGQAVAGIIGWVEG